jgi:hypothetical protein
MVIHSSKRIKFPNYISPYYHGIVLGGDVKCVALAFALDVSYSSCSLQAFEIAFIRSSSKWHSSFLQTKLSNCATFYHTVSELRSYTGIQKKNGEVSKVTLHLQIQLFLTPHGHNIHCQQRELSKFLMRYQQFASHACSGAAEPVFNMASQQ